MLIYRWSYEVGQRLQGMRTHYGVNYSLYAAHLIPCPPRGDIHSQRTAQAKTCRVSSEHRATSYRRLGWRGQAWTMGNQAVWRQVRLQPRCASVDTDAWAWHARVLSDNTRSLCGECEWSRRMGGSQNVRQYGAFTCWNGNDMSKVALVRHQRACYIQRMLTAIQFGIISHLDWKNVEFKLLQKYSHSCFVWL